MQAGGDEVETEKDLLAGGHGLPGGPAGSNAVAELGLPFDALDGQEQQSRQYGEA